MNQEALIMRPASSQEVEVELETLADLVLIGLGRPIDRQAVAAVLESHGMRDQDAVEKYEKKDIFDLAEAVYERCRARLAAKADPPLPLALVRPQSSMHRFLVMYLRGLSFNAPWAIQMVILLTRGYALGIYMRFSEYQATLVAIGILLSLIVTGGFVQIIGRIGGQYSAETSPRLTRRVYSRLVGAGMIVTLLVALTLYGLDAAFGPFSSAEIATSLAYYVLFSVMWLMLGMLNALHLRPGVIVATIGGLTVVALIMELTPLGIFVAHWLGLLAANLIAGAWAYAFFRRHLSADQGQAINLSGLGQRLVTMLPYFIYGSLYFFFLFLDRLVGWSVGTPRRFFIWFRTPYELGLVLALVSFFVTVPVLEYMADRSIWRMHLIQGRFSALRITDHNRFFLRTYIGDIFRVLATALVSFAWLLALLHLAHSLGLFEALIGNPITEPVFYWGVLGYGLLVWGLMNSLFLFAMSRPWLVVRAMTVAFVIDGLAGFILSRNVAYWYSVIGLVAGTLIFVLLTTRDVVRGFRKMDYYSYSAY